MSAPARDEMAIAADAALAAETAAVDLEPRSRVTRCALGISEKIGTAAQFGSGTLLAVVVVVVSVSVFNRYVLGSPLVWAEDLSLRAFVWMCFLGLVCLTERQTALSLPVLVNKLSGRPRLIVAIGSTALSAYVFWILFDWGRIVLVNVAGTKSAALGLPGWTLYAAAPTAGFVCLVVVVVQLACLIEMAIRSEAP